jgi:hypothetical protein
MAVGSSGFMASTFNSCPAEIFVTSLLGRPESFCEFIDGFVAVIARPWYWKTSAA